MVAVKSPTAAPERTSLNVATTPENCVPAMASSRLPWASTVGGGGVTLALDRAVPTTVPFWSLTVTVIGYQPAWA